MLSKANSNSLVETSAAPEWLSKLENRQERKLTSAKLGHEKGAGAPCNACGDKCPGLALHFWRKVCRNCKCRKDEHLCINDDLSGWAQFEILGQIRSKPAYIKMKAFSNKPVNVEWVPPNVEPDVIVDYMDKLDVSQIPVTGSKAAHKRKQQLEFQVPPHDLDATLCDNLNEGETQQMQQYIQKLRKQCVGQGTVVRIGGAGIFNGLDILTYLGEEKSVCSPELMEVLYNLDEYPILNSVLNILLLGNKKFVIENPAVDPTFSKLFDAFSEPPLEPTAPFHNVDLRTNQTNENIYGLSNRFDKIKEALKHNNPKMVHIMAFCKEYVTNPQFKAVVDSLYVLQQETPEKIREVDILLNVPIPTNQSHINCEKEVNPVFNVPFEGVNSVINECSLPHNMNYEKDPIFKQIVNCDQLKEALKCAVTGYNTNIVISSVSLTSDIMEIKGLDEQLKTHLKTMGLNEIMLRSSIANKSYYDQLFFTLNDRGINFSNCRLLTPLHQIHNWLLNDDELLKNLEKVFEHIGNNENIKYNAISLTSEVGDLIYLQNNDSDFQSKPPTTNPSNHLEDELTAISASFSNAFQQIKDDKKTKVATTEPVQSLTCHDCKLAIKFGEIAVKVDRASKEFVWHPECFKCCTCRELLADLVYFFHHSNVFCCRDLAIKLKIPRCKACDELIFTKEYTAAEGYTFHIKHFCCYQCDTPLAGRQYIPDEKNNMPLCLSCYNEFLAVTCQLCRQPIGPADQGIAWGEVHWHGKCFVCAGIKCGKSLMGSYFCVKHNKPFCSPACIRSCVH